MNGFRRSKPPSRLQLQICYQLLFSTKMILKEVIKDPFEDSRSVIGPVMTCVQASVYTHTQLWSVPLHSVDLSTCL